MKVTAVVGIACFIAAVCGAYPSVEEGGFSNDLPAITTVLQLYSEEEIRLFLQDEDQDAAVVGYFPLPLFEKELLIFREVGRVLEQKFRFAFTTDDKMIRKMKLNTFAVFLYKPERDLYSPMDHLQNRYPYSELNHTSLSWFIETLGVPLVGVKTLKNRERYEDTPIPEFTVFTEVNLETNSKKLKFYVNHLLEVAKVNLGLMTFNIVEISEISVGFEKSVGRSLREGMVAIRQHELFFFPGEDFIFSTAAVESFVDAVRSGMIAGKLPRSPEDSVDDFDPAVIKLTNQNFNAVVHRDTSKDVLVEFYAPWCGHCKALKPEFNAVGKMFEGENSIIVAAMDATVNTVPREYSIKGYPTIVLSVATSDGAVGRPEPILYDGARSAKDIIAFVRKHAKSLTRA